MFNKSLLSSKTDLWETPQILFDSLDSEFHFTLDPCALPENAKCSKFYTPEQDGLKQDWSNEIVFCNPPYGVELSKWVRKCWYESWCHGAKVVMLIPSRTDTKYFHSYIFPFAKVRFLQGRLKFGNCKNSAPFPSCIVVFNKFLYDYR